MAKVTAKYQVTIPLAVRKELNIVPGMEVDIEKQGRKYILVVVPVKMVKNKWRGFFKGQTTTMAYLNEVRGKIE